MSNQQRKPSLWRRIASKIHDILPTPIQDFWYNYKSELEDVETRLTSPDKTVKDWKRTYIEDRKRLKRLKFGEKAIPIIGVVVTLALAVSIFSLLVRGLVLLISFIWHEILYAFFSLPVVLRLMFYVIVGFCILALFIFVVNWLRKLFNVPLPYEDEDGGLYDMVLKTGYRAITDGDTGGEMCHKIGFYKPKSPEAMRPVSMETSEIGTVEVYNLEFRKLRVVDMVDEEQFKRLFEKSLKRMRKAGKLLLPEINQVPYNGRLYEPLLVIDVFQDPDTVTASLAFADENSIEMLLNSRDTYSGGGDLYDE